MCDLVGNHKDRFSHKEAHIIITADPTSAQTYNLKVTVARLFPMLNPLELYIDTDRRGVEIITTILSSMWPSFTSRKHSTLYQHMHNAHAWKINYFCQLVWLSCPHGVNVHTQGSGNGIPG